LVLSAFIGVFIKVFYRLIGGVALWVGLCGGTVAAADFTFAAFGDTPYSRDEEARFPDLIAEMNREKLAFVVHVGDFKNAIDACTDALFAQRRQWFDLSHHPFVFVPGDNEWTDCGRAFADRRDPLERLQKLREVFSSGTESLGQRPIRLERQSNDYPEHARWEYQGVLFLTLNAPGPDNHARVADEYARREPAMRKWVFDSFALARKRKAQAVAIFMQGDPWTAAGESRRGFALLLESIASETRAFSGEVLLVHGDTHRFRVDQPLRDAAGGAGLANFTRVEVFGYPTMNWVRIRVGEEAGRIRFSVTPGS
jgi:hypothetical protein